MAYIYKKPRRQKTDRDRQRQKMYQNKAYRQLRDWYYMEHPLCEECLKDNVVTPARDIHHILSPFDTNISEVEGWRRLLDSNNFVSLCRFHHNKVHGKASRLEIDEYNEMIEKRKKDV